MPLFNQIGQPRWNSPLIRFFGMKIGSAAAPSLAPEIAPSFDVNQQDDPTLPYLRGEQVWSVGQQVAAVAAQFSEARISNPAGSGVIAVVDQICAFVGSSVCAYKLIVDTGDLTSVGNPYPLDSRIGLVNSPIRFTYRTSAVAQVSAPYSWLSSANDPGPNMPPIVLHPGYAICITHLVVNQTLWFSARFRFRAVPAEELATG